MRAALTVAVALVFALGAIPLAAHHGSSQYDTTKPVTLTGTLTSVEMVNPHAFIYIDVKDDKGKTENWALEGTAPNQLIRSGMKELLKPGLQVAVIGWLPRNGSKLPDYLSFSPGASERLKTMHVMQAGEIRLADGIHPFGMGPQMPKGQ